MNDDDDPKAADHTFRYDIEVTPTELARNLSKTLHRVRYEHQEFTVATAAREPIARFVPYGPAPHMTARELVGLLLRRLPVVAFDEVAARVHAVTWAELAAKGVNVGAHDLMIAATALAIGWGVATHDARGFPKIPGLRLARW